MIRIFKTWCENTKGATAIEYALIASGISLALAVIVYIFGADLSTFFSELAEALRMT